jgi:hypothetical protein
MLSRNTTATCSQPLQTVISPVVGFYTSLAFTERVGLAIHLGKHVCIVRNKVFTVTQKPAMMVLVGVTLQLYPTHLFFPVSLDLCMHC